MAIKENYLVEKRNILNELRSNNMTLQELRFFSIYLAKINSRDITTRLVRFPLEDFQKIMDFGKMNIKQLNTTADNLLSKIISIPKKSGGFEKFQLFKKCVLDTDNNNEWYIEINAHDDALSLMFEFKEKYFSYQLWNALRLKSSNQLRIYEILKQYEKIGEKIINIDELKEILGISKGDYRLWSTFKRDVLEVCKKALEENTDIKFNYEPYGKKGKGGKILTLKFKIYKNKDHKDALTLDEFIDGETTEVKDIENPYQKRFNFLKEACNNEFTDKEFQLIYNLVMQIIPTSISYSGLDIDQYNYIKRKYDELNFRATKTNIKNRFGYFKKIIESDLD